MSDKAPVWFFRNNNDEAFQSSKDEPEVCYEKFSLPPKDVIGSLIQPIETAPKDGTTFWGIVRGDAIHMFWHKGFGEFVSSYRVMTWVGREPEEHSPVIHRPRCWLPKPTIPDEDDV